LIKYNYICRCWICQTPNTSSNRYDTAT